MLNEKLGRFIRRNSFPGSDQQGFLRYLAVGALISSVYELGSFLLNYVPARARLYTADGALRPDRVIARFGELTRNCSLGAVIIALSMVGFMIGNFLEYRRGSMSVYLMKRLPRRGERLRRAIILPLAGAGAILALYFLLLLFCFLIWAVGTPRGHLPAGLF